MGVSGFPGVLIFVFSSAHVSLMQDSLLQLALHKTSHQHEANSINPIIRIKFLYLEKINQLVCIRFHFLSTFRFWTCVLPS